MSNVIQFKRKADGPYQHRAGSPPYSEEPTFTIDIYERPEHGGFNWVVTGDGDPPTREQLSDYLGDMFLSLHPETDDDSGIFQRAAAFFSNLFHPSKD